jgi:U5 small nuclear ribonucleoprotein component
MLKCDAEGPTVVHITKLYNTSDAQEFRAFGRVMSGTVRRGQVVKVLGEGYSLEDEEDMSTAVVDSVLIDESRWVISHIS